MTTTKLDYETLCEIHGQELVDRQIELEARMASMGVAATRFDRANPVSKAVT